MSRWRDHPESLGWRLNHWIGPERVAFVLSVLVIIAIALALGIGPFSASPGASPSVPASEAPSETVIESIGPAVAAIERPPFRAGVDPDPGSAAGGPARSET
jgi:hypothetical protein